MLSLSLLIREYNRELNFKILTCNPCPRSVPTCFGPYQHQLTRFLHQEVALLYLPVSVEGNVISPQTPAPVSKQGTKKMTINVLI